MRDYEVIIESMTPCGGEEHAIRRIEEVCITSPEEYVQENKRFPILEITASPAGDTVILTGNKVGYRDRYTFTIV